MSGCVWEWLGGPARCLGVSGSGREALPDVGEWSVDPPLSPRLVGRPSWMFGSGREVLPDVLEVSGLVERTSGMSGSVREWSGGPPGCPGVVGRPSRMSGSGR